MRPGQWTSSVLFVVFVAAKVAETAWQLEDWPLSYVPMFSVRLAPESLPRRIRLIAARGDEWLELGPSDLGLSRDELDARLVFARDLAAPCAELGRIYNRTRPPGAQLTQLYAKKEWIPRPGVPLAYPPSTTTCPLAPATR